MLLILEKIKIMQEGIYKKGSHLIFFWASMAFTVNLFRQFSDRFALQILWTLFAVALELLKNYLIRIIKTRYKVEAKPILVAFIFVYVITGIISGICTFGSVKSSLSEQQFKAELANNTTETTQDNILVVDSVVETLLNSVNSSVAEKEKMSGLDGAYYSGQERMTEDLNNSIDNIERMLTMKSTLSTNLVEEKEDVKSVGADIFTMMGADVGLSGEQTLFWIFMALIVILEVALFLTADPFMYLETANTEENEVDVVLKYISALEKENGSVILNSDNNIAEATGISRKDCKRYRVLLKELKHRGKALISDNNRMNWNTSSMNKVVRDYFAGEEA